jgi:hypothetical protein
MMATLPRVMHPLMDGLSHRNDCEMFQQLAHHVLLNSGMPTDWGRNRSVSPSSFGLASSVSQPYTLDADKVTRLNSDNSFALTYAQVLDSLRISNIAFRLSVQTFFDTAISLVSSVDNGNETWYYFEVTTQNAGSAVVSNLSCYVVIVDFVNSTLSQTDAGGTATVALSVPNSANGTALLVVFAKAAKNPSMASFGVCSFSHRTSAPQENEIFARLSPLNCALNVTFNDADKETVGAYAFSYGYRVNLTILSNSTGTSEYSFPLFLDQSPTVLVLTGSNGTESFAEWVAYPMVPLEIGVNFDSSTANSNVFSNAYVVAINGALYRLRMECRRVG